MPKPEGLEFEVWPHQDSFERKVTVRGSQTTNGRTIEWSNVVISAISGKSPSMSFNSGGTSLELGEWESFRYLVEVGWRAWRLHFERTPTTTTTASGEVVEEKTIWQSICEDDS